MSGGGTSYGSISVPLSCTSLSLFLCSFCPPLCPSLCPALSCPFPCSASYYELTVGASDRDKQKSSGLLIFTGSGSTAWAYNINRVTPFQVGKILQLGKVLPCDGQARVSCG